MICEVFTLNPANKATLIRIALIPVFILCFYLGKLFPGFPQPLAYYIALGIFIFACLTDLWDGWYARKHGLVSNFGKLMDPMADKLLTSTAFILLCAAGKLPALFAIVFIGREFVISAFRMIAVEQGNVIAAGILGKTKTVLQFVTVCILILDIPMNGALWVPASAVAMIACIFTVWSCIDYILKNKNVIKGEKE